MTTAARPTTVIVDFDGTITGADVGDELCERFAEPRWRELDRLWEEKRLALPDAQEGMWALVSATPAALLEHARAVGSVRPGLDALLDAARAPGRGTQVVLASGGFAFYIEAILGERLRRFDAVYANRGVLEGGRVRVSFPHRERLGCALCAVCKGRLCDEARQAGRRVVFIGDGTSDRCAIGRADVLCAVRGGKLAAACAALGAEVVQFEHFDELLPWLLS